MWLWASLIVGWLALLAVGIWVTAVAGGGWSSGIRARYLAYAPALGMQLLDRFRRVGASSGSLTGRLVGDVGRDRLGGRGSCVGHLVLGEALDGGGR